MATARNQRRRGFSENVYVTERQLGSGRVAGPFSATDVIRALEGQGWTRTNDPALDEFAVYRHPNGPRMTVVSPEWTRIHEGDPIFRVLAHDMGLSQAELTGLVRAAQR